MHAVSYPAVDWMAVIDRHYGDNAPLRHILLTHSRMVADMALECARFHSLDIDDSVIEAGAMLHDIGIFLTDAPGIHCHGAEHYLRHGLLGAAVLRADGAPLWVQGIAMHHTGAGLTRDDIVGGGLPLPVADFLPQSPLETLICYADKFYSKTRLTERKPLEAVRRGMARFSAGALARFDAMHAAFGLPG